MQLSEARAEFDRLLRVHGAEVKNPDPKLVWAAYREFASVEFRTAVSTLRFKADVTAGPEFDLYHVNCIREFNDREYKPQLEFEGGDDNGFPTFITLPPPDPPVKSFEMEIEMAYEVTEELIYGGGLFETSFRNSKVDDILSRIESHSVFDLTFSAHRPIHYQIKTSGKPW